MLANKLGARTQHDLDAAEHDFAEFRALELLAKPIRPSFDEDHLRAIHRYLFQDVYEWAGEPRTVNTSKPDDPAAFFPRQLFDTGVPAVFGQIAERNFRPDMPQDEFVNKLTRTYDELNHLHLFREGNGRTQRIFLNQLAARSGYAIDWNAVTAEQNDAVCRAAGHGDRQPMKAMLETVVQPAPRVQRPARNAQRHRLLERNRQASPTNDPQPEDQSAAPKARLADRARAYVDQQDRTAQERSAATKRLPAVDRPATLGGPERQQ
ncbi:Fic/DOC family protein [Kribbella sp. NPDC051587]|uniref:Fic/DOC family protein n=1 Tax=Kribbella sp. NPDC051587 TaxID=3364119 RepID=UPI00379950CD